MGEGRGTYCMGPAVVMTIWHVGATDDCASDGGIGCAHIFLCECASLGFFLFSASIGVTGALRF